MSNRFIRTELLLGDESLKKLKAAKVAVFGLGGVGGSCVEALARCGVGTLGIIDSDTVSISNLNRQILATEKSLGMRKTDAAEQRIYQINPEAMVVKYPIFYTADSYEPDLSAYDYVVDAIDTVSAKIALIQKAAAANVPIISCMGTGSKLDPMGFVVADIYETSVCPLAKVMRTELKRRGIASLKVVYSKEPPLKTSPIYDPSSPKRIVGSVSFVPPAAGLLLASEAIKYLSGKKS